MATVVGVMHRVKVEHWYSGLGGRDMGVYVPTCFGVVMRHKHVEYVAQLGHMWKSWWP